MNTQKALITEEMNSILEILKTRFLKDHERFPNLNWEDIKAKFDKNPEKLRVVHEMEKTGGEPHLLEYHVDKDEYLFCDFSKESPKGRRSLCYDKEAWEARKKFKPEDNARDVAARIGVQIMNEEEYRKLQAVEEVDTKTSSWLNTPEKIRKLGGAIFGDFRFGQVFIYHNGADSYYAARGFRGILRL